MARSSIADRYLKTLESNSLENAPKSPPKSVRPTTQLGSRDRSPLKASTQNGPRETPRIQTNQARSTATTKQAAIQPKSQSSSHASTATAKQPTGSAVKSLNAGSTAARPASPAKSVPRSTPASPLPAKSTSATSVQAKSTLAASPVKSTTASTQQTKSTPVKSALAASTLAKATPTTASPVKMPSSQSRQSLGPKPDRNPLMHNQDLTPSQISWDSERKNWQAYEYLCHITEAKEWMEKVLGEQLPPAEMFPESLQNGIALAKITRAIRPDLMEWPIFEHKRLQYRHTENITLFFNLLAAMNIPQLFLFDMTDLYEKRNLPKVIYCIHAVSHFIAESESTVTAVDDLVGKLEFSEDQISTTEKGMAGHAMPNFGKMTRQLSGKHPKLEIPAEDEEDEEEEEAEEEAEHDLEDDPEEGDDSMASIEEPQLKTVSRRRPKSNYRARENYRTRETSEITEDDTLDSIMEDSRNASDSDDSMLDLKPPRRYRKARQVSRDSSLDSLSSLRAVSRELYNGRYSQYDRRQYQSSGYRNLSSTGSLRSRVLSTAELMLMELEELEPETVRFQAICRAALARRSLKSSLRSRDSEAWATKLQAVGRGVLTRRFYSRDLPHLSDEQRESLVRLQSIIRATAVRKSFSTTATKANSIVYFQGLARGCLLRRQLASRKLLLQSNDSRKGIVAVQSIFRGVILRFRLSCLYDSLEHHVGGIVKLQAHARGLLARRGMSTTTQTWNVNVDKVILLQSVWRARAQGSRYRTLIADSNPTLEAIKPFLHLIDDKPEDYEREIQFESIMREIGSKLKTNEQLEARIDQLDMKISLLVKNNISIDEIVLSQQRQNRDIRRQLEQEKQLGIDLGIDKHLKRRTHESTNEAGLKDQFDPNTLQKSSRDRVELYQGLLYIWQTQPEYLSRLMANKPPKSLNMEDLVLAIFGNAESHRENFFLMRQLAHSITKSTVGSPENTVAWCIVARLNRRKESIDIARRILSPATEKLKVFYDQLLEYDPHIIYEHLTGGADLSAEEAIQDPSVRTLFVQNLQRLREVSMTIVQSLANKAADLPYHIRFVAREVYREVLEITRDRNEAMAAAGQVVISQYLQPALLAADSLDLVDGAAGNTSKNLVLVGRVLHQVGLMLPFDASGSTDIYLQPLNEFVKSSAHHLALQFQTAILECPDPSIHYKFSELDDITMHDRPILNISMDHLLALHYMCFHFSSSLSNEHDRMLKPVIEQLGPLPKDAREMLDLARFKEIKLELNPRYGTASLRESTAGSSSLMMTTKRCLGYVLRVQSNQPDLMSVLVAPVELEDEHRYTQILDMDNTREVAGELGNLTFRELKLLTLERILELESSGCVSRSDGYQALINAVADDIRNKDSVRRKKQLNIESKLNTLRGLDEKSKYLQNRLEVYGKHVDEAMTTLQMKAQEANLAKGKRGLQRFQLSPSKQVNGHGLDQPGARFGQHKLSADKLYERGILIRLRGYNDRQRKDVQFTFSCDKVAEFQLDVSYKGILLPNGSIQISLDSLLNEQYQNHAHVNYMGDELQFSTNRLLQLILHKFFGTP